MTSGHSPEHAGITKSAEYRRSSARRPPASSTSTYEHAIAEVVRRSRRVGTAASGVLAEDRGSCCCGATPGSGARTAAISLLGASPSKRSEPIHELGHQRDEPRRRRCCDSARRRGGRPICCWTSRPSAVEQVRRHHAPSWRPSREGVKLAVDRLLVVVVPAGDDDLMAHRASARGRELGTARRRLGVRSSISHAHDASANITNPPWPQLEAILLQRGTMAEIDGPRANRARGPGSPARERDLADLIDAGADRALRKRANEVAARVARQRERQLPIAAPGVGHARRASRSKTCSAAQRGLDPNLWTSARRSSTSSSSSISRTGFAGSTPKSTATRPFSFPGSATQRRCAGTSGATTRACATSCNEWVAERDSQNRRATATSGDEFVRRFADACLSARTAGRSGGGDRQTGRSGSSAQVALAASALAYGLERSPHATGGFAGNASDGRRHGRFDRRSPSSSSRHASRTSPRTIPRGSDRALAPPLPGTTTDGVVEARWIRADLVGRRSSDLSPTAGSTGASSARLVSTIREIERDLFLAVARPDRTRGRRRPHRSANRRSRRSR